MRSTRVNAILAGLLALAVFPVAASAYLHPQIGRFAQQDSLGYRITYVDGKPVRVKVDEFLSNYRRTRHADTLAGFAGQW